MARNGARRNRTPRTSKGSIAGTAAFAALLVAAPAARGGDGEMVYVALGDSTGVGVGAVAGGGYPERLATRLQRAGQRVRLVNLSVSGATAADLRRHQLVGVERAGPSLVTLAIGENDIGHGRSEQDFARDLEVVAVHLAELRVPVVAANIPDVALVPAAALVPPAMLARIERFNAAIRRIAHRYQWRLVDLYARSREALSQGAWSLLSADGFHPSDEGYERWADAMWPAVEGAVAVVRPWAGRRAPR